jgi:hypothetical protein
MFPPMGPDRADELAAGDTSVGFRPDSRGRRPANICGTGTHRDPPSHRRPRRWYREEVINWIIDNQLGRRNMTPEAKSYLRGKRYNIEKRQGERTDLTSPENQGKSTTAERLAKTYQVSRDTIEKDAQFAEAIDTLEAEVKQDIRQAVLKRKMTPEAKSYLRGKRYNLEKKSEGRPSGKLPQNAGETAERLGVAYQVNPATIERDGEFAEAVDTLEAVARVRPRPDFFASV